jgi:hypothetical protein
MAAIDPSDIEERDKHFTYAKFDQQIAEIEPQMATKLEGRTPKNAKL